MYVPYVSHIGEESRPKETSEAAMHLEASAIASRPFIQRQYGPPRFAAFVVVLLALGVWAAAAWVWLAPEPMLRPPEQTGVLIIWFFVGVLLPILAWISHLEVRVDDRTIRLRLFPFWARRIRLDEITDCAPRQYQPIREYGGWGVRFWSSGWAYSMHGRQGVQLKLRDKSPVMIGSDDPAPLADAINTRRQQHA